ncbi:MAG: NAD(P)/FAD-dependent oxidoreductase [Planctomycetota bacterium]|jgi:phytoene dehydrogenase-like protein|nr:NAD(P)/FAD-dependent oxidoreductase [Planctomycetota bacterium]MDP6764126.1 NAD(P)/FAD-dependent oxidoreductase [Planctomycetota bacterium]
MSTQDKHDAVIIGAGMSGLAAGIRLAGFGQRVVVLERHTLWGGLNSFYKRAGRRFDVGLHALTNFVGPRTPGAPLTRVLRALRLRHADLGLRPQRVSRIRFPGVALSFCNDFGLLQQEVDERFPDQRDGFARLAGDLSLPADAASPRAFEGARTVLREYLSDPLLVDMLLLPICFYGSAREDDVDWYQFNILFQSLFVEGFARPAGGIKPLLDLLLERLDATGGELRLGCGVERVLLDAGRVRGVLLEDGSVLSTDLVLSSAGHPETMELCGPTAVADHVDEGDLGRLAFTESIHVLDRKPVELGHDAAVTFFNHAERFRWRCPQELIDPTSGVICCPDNYVGESETGEGLLRLTTLANHDRWAALGPQAYSRAKGECTERALDVAHRFAFDPRPHEVYRDTFSPTTVRRYTGRRGGAVYGSPRKRLDGRTPFDGLNLIGTDQGLLGIVGALLSGITIANRHALSPA